MNRIIHTLGFAALATTLLLTACAKEQPTVDPDDASRFTVSVEDPVEANGSKISYSYNNNNNFSFQDGDKIWVNGSICLMLPRGNSFVLYGSVGQVPAGLYYCALSEGFYSDDTRVKYTSSDSYVQIRNVVYPRTITRTSVTGGYRINAPLVAIAPHSSSSARTSLLFKHAAAYIDVKLTNYIHSETNSAWFIDSIVVSSDRYSLSGTANIAVQKNDRSVRTDGIDVGLQNSRSVVLHVGAAANNKSQLIPVYPASSRSHITVSVYARATSTATETTVFTQRTTNTVGFEPGKSYKAPMQLYSSDDNTIGASDYGDGGRLW